MALIRTSVHNGLDRAAERLRKAREKMDGQESVTKSAVAELLGAMTIRGGVDYFAMGAVAYRDMLGRVIDAPVDADGNLLQVGDEYSVWPNRKRVHVIEELSIDYDGRWYITFQRMPQGPDVAAYCSQVYKVVPDSRERIEADAGKSPCDYYGHKNDNCTETCPAYGDVKSCHAHMALDLVRRCFALVDGEGR